MKTIMTIACVFLISACGNDKTNKKDRQGTIPTSTAISIPLLEGVSENSLWDYSSEKRCDGIKEFLISFSEQRLSGALSNFNCFETPVAQQSYVASAELKFDNEVIQFSISAYRNDGNAKPCIGEFEADPIDLSCPIVMPVATDRKTQTARNDFPILFKKFVETKQTKKLVYEISPEVFNNLAIDKLSSVEGIDIPFKGTNYQFFFKLNPSNQDVSKGQLSIKKIVPSSGYEIFGCSDEECQNEKLYSYEILEHWFTFYGDRKMSAFVIPDPK